ncbi:hypothetical protein [Anaerofustis stercorihominis]|uniref:DUF3021 domain-containing protein n=2 Tax=Anaerofustis stercorihominis TaxID=214853 RepID=B1C6R9_9FIRM|nr:hypothetical protein [Anaerofustis stercorihominis]EDS72706.1 hypothetical protein ANASTE_00416 [Anaerofustis stercorihominis DSM 17244]MCQ4794080.1 hypothetical protein [Anaerofustis stercorihominis]RGD74618.1 hypothetical protein DW687_07625 [Anaerofustis stercorihominis]
MKKLITICSTSFTVVMLLTTLLVGTDMSPNINRLIILQLFLMSLTISILLVLLDKLEDKIGEYYESNLIRGILSRIIICYFVVFFEGIYFKMFDFSLHSLLSISPIVLIAFIVTYIVSYMICYKETEEINEVIKRKKDIK